MVLASILAVLCESVESIASVYRKELRAWAMYDWANSAFVTTIMGAVLPVYFVNVSATSVPDELRTAYWGYTQTVALIFIALTSPFLGAAADYLGATKKFLARRASTNAELSAA